MYKKLLSKKNFRMLDYVSIPFSTCTLGYMAKVLRCVYAALFPVLNSLALADFVDTTVSIYDGKLPFDSIYFPLFCLIGLIILSYLQWQIMAFVNIYISNKMEFKYTNAFISRWTELEYECMEDPKTLDLISRVCNNPVNKLNYGFGTILDGVEIVVRILSFLITVSLYVWWAPIMLIIFIAPLSIVGIRCGEDTYETNVEVTQVERFSSYLDHLLRGKGVELERKIFDYTDFIEDKWDKAYDCSQKKRLDARKKFYRKSTLGNIVSLMQSAIVIVFLLFLLDNGSISIGTFIGMTTVALSLFEGLAYNIIALGSDIIISKKNIEEINVFFNLPYNKENRSKPLIDKVSFNCIEFDNVSFKYPNTDKYILKNFNLKIERGKCYAIIGINGVGKTTLIKLLLKLYENYDGRILIDGRDLHKIGLAEIKSMIAVVFQDFSRYYLSVAENVYVGNVNKKDINLLKKYLSDVGLDSLVDSLPEGVDTKLGRIYSDGIDLSGGEWQRLAIARALYSENQLLILDEPTASLDPIAEREFYSLFCKNISGKTSIIISHRLGITKACDEIIVINDGRVEEIGDHDELMQQNGLYTEMFNKQREWYGEVD